MHILGCITKTRIIVRQICLFVSVYFSECIFSDKDEEAFAFVEETALQENVENLPEEFNWEKLPKNNLPIISAKTHENTDITKAFNIWKYFLKIL